jgi:hypothetical protein
LLLGLPANSAGFLAAPEAINIEARARLFSSPNAEPPADVVCAHETFGPSARGVRLASHRVPDGLARPRLVGRLMHRRVRSPAHQGEHCGCSCEGGGDSHGVANPATPAIS